MFLQSNFKFNELRYTYEKSGEACKLAHLDPQRAVVELLLLCSSELALEAKHGSIKGVPTIGMHIEIYAGVL